MFGLYQPPPGYHFTLKIVDSVGFGLAGAAAGAAAALYDNSFMEISGLSATVQIDSVQEGGNNDIIYRLPKGREYANLVLKRGLVTLASPFQDWCEETITSLDYKFTLKDVTVMLLDNKHTPVKAWKLEKAIPVKYEIAGFDSMSGKLMVENIELAYQRITRDKAIEMLVKANQAAAMASLASSAVSGASSAAKAATSTASAIASEAADTAAVGTAVAGGAAAATSAVAGAAGANTEKIDNAKDDIDNTTDDIKDSKTDIKKTKKDVDDEIDKNL